MKKLLLAGLISSLCSGAAFASDESAIADAKAEKEGVRYNTAIGPYVDPIFDAAIVIVPTWSYEIGDSEKTSQSKLYGIYGTNGNWVLRADTDNYFGKWFQQSQFFYNYAKLDVGDFMDPNNATVEVETTSFSIDNFLGYQFADDFYFGPALYYSDATYERGHAKSPYDSINMIPDGTELSYGLKGILDKRDNQFRPTDGMYLSLDVRHHELESKGGASFPDAWLPSLPPGTPQTLNGETEYKSVTADFRYYTPISKNTSLAYRAQAAWKGDEAQTRATTIKKVASGFTMEVSGKSAYGTELQVRHYMNDATGFVSKLGFVGGLSLAQAVDVAAGGDDDLHYAVTGGLRYTLNNEDKTAARLDVSYNDQEEDNLVVYFEVNEKF